MRPTQRSNEGLGDGLRAWATNLPKIDLHRHLEGTLRPETLLDIARKYGIQLPADDVTGLRSYVQMIDETPGFERFLSKFQLLRKFYVSPEVIQRIVREAILDAAADRVFYLELRTNPLALARAQGFAFADVVAWVVEAVQAAQAEAGLRTCLILQIPREEPVAVAEEIVDVAIANFGPVVRGIDLAGNERCCPPHLFAGPFARAKAAGLHITVHAGEASGPESVWGALEVLSAHRIGHGIRAVEDPALLALLRERNVTLEVCPTSNLHTGVVLSWAQHPLRALWAEGLRVTLNTDDPAISAITLTDEYVAAVAHLSISKKDIYHMMWYAAEAAFIPSDERPWLLDRMQRALLPYLDAHTAFEDPV